MPLFHKRRGSYSPKGGPARTQSVTLASATLLSKSSLRRITRSRRLSWQAEAWSFYDTIGELHYATKFYSNLVGRAHLYIGQPEPEGGGDPRPADNPPDLAVTALRELHYGQIGQAEMLRRIALHLAVAGESYLIGMDPRPEDGPGERQWIVASTDEFSTSGGRPRVKLPDTGESADLDPEQATIIRLWMPHPRCAWEPDSSIRANLPALREVQALSQHITATVESRLAGAGVLTIPHSATMPNPASSESDGVEALHPDPFVDGLMQAIIPPIQDRDHPSAVVPVIIKVPDEAVGKIQHLTFATELDSKVTEMRESALRRFAGGSDLPGEVILGIGDSSHWNAFAIEEQTVKLAAEPLLGVICDALTQQYLWPSLRAAGVPDPESWLIWYDTSELTQPPDRAAEAQALHQVGALSAEALLRENGFSLKDRPTDEERRNELARQLVLAKPELLPVLAKYVGFESEQEEIRHAVQSMRPTQPGPGSNELGGRSSTTRAMEGVKPKISPSTGNRGDRQPNPRSVPSRKPARELTAAGDSAVAAPEAEREWVIKAVEGIALRALELAGKRLLNQTPRGVRGKPEAQRVHAWDLHTIAPKPSNTDVDRLLTGAYELMSQTLGDQPCIQQAVDAYCRALLASGRPHRREYLEQTLAASGCLAASS